VPNGASVALAQVFVLPVGDRPPRVGPKPSVEHAELVVVDRDGETGVGKDADGAAELRLVLDGVDPDACRVGFCKADRLEAHERHVVDQDEADQRSKSRRGTDVAAIPCSAGLFMSPLFEQTD